MKRTGLVLLAGILISGGCAFETVAGPDDAPRALAGDPVPVFRFDGAVFGLLWHGDFAGPAQIVVRTRPDWVDAWARLHTGRHAPPMPEVDFDRDVVLIVAMGMQPSSGYVIEVEEAHRRGEAVHVAVSEWTPGRRCGVRDAITYPIDVVRVPAAGMAFEFATTRSVRDC